MAQIPKNSNKISSTSRLPAAEEEEAKTDLKCTIYSQFPASRRQTFSCPTPFKAGALGTKQHSWICSVFAQTGVPPQLQTTAGASFHPFPRPCIPGNTYRQLHWPSWDTHKAYLETNDIHTPPILCFRNLDFNMSALFVLNLLFSKERLLPSGKNFLTIWSFFYSITACFQSPLPFFTSPKIITRPTDSIAGWFSNILFLFFVGCFSIPWL